MSYDYRAKRTVIIVDETLAIGVAMNVIGHLAVALGAVANEDLMGRPVLRDRSGVEHRGISRYAVIVKKASAAQIRSAIRLGRDKPALLIVDYPQQMLTTGHDDELAASLEEAVEDTLQYLGALFYGPTPAVDEVCRKFSLWR